MKVLAGNSFPSTQFFLFSIALGVLLLTPAAVSGESAGALPGDWVIGQCAALQGPASGLGTGMNAGMKAYFEEKNSRGGVHGRKIRFIAANDDYEPDRTVDCTLNLIEKESVFALAGYVGTPTAKAALPILQEMKVPLVGAFTGAGVLRSPVSRYVFNVRASYDDETEALVERLTADLGIKEIAVFYQDDAFGQAGLSGTEKALARRGLKVKATGTFLRNTEAVKTGLASVMAASPGAVVMVGPYKPLAAFVKEAQNAGLKSVLATISFVGTESLIKELGGAADGIVISQVVPSPGDAAVPIVAECRAALKKTSGDPLTYVSLEGCVTARTLVAGMEKAGANPSREALVDALESLSGMDIGGLGITFGKDNHQGLNKVYMTQVDGGKANPVNRIVKR